MIAVEVSSPLRKASQLNAPWKTAHQIINIMAQLPNKLSLQKATIVIKPTSVGTWRQTSPASIRLSRREKQQQKKKCLHCWTASDRNNRPMIFPGRIDQLSFRITAVSFQGSELPQSTKAEFTNLASRDKVTIGTIKEKISSLYSCGSYKDAYAEIVLRDSTASVNFVNIPNPQILSVEISGDSVIANEELLPFIDSLKHKPSNSDSTRAALDNIWLCIATGDTPLPGSGPSGLILRKETCGSSSMKA